MWHWGRLGAFLIFLRVAAGAGSAEVPSTSRAANEDQASVSSAAPSVAPAQEACELLRRHLPHWVHEDAWFKTITMDCRFDKLAAAAKAAASAAEPAPAAKLAAQIKNKNPLPRRCGWLSRVVRAPEMARWMKEQWWFQELKTMCETTGWATDGPKKAAAKKVDKSLKARCAWIVKAFKEGQGQRLAKQDWYAGVESDCNAIGTHKRDLACAKLEAAKKMRRTRLYVLQKEPWYQEADAECKGKTTARGGAALAAKGGRRPEAGVRSTAIPEGASKGPQSTFPDDAAHPHGEAFMLATKCAHADLGSPAAARSAYRLPDSLAKRCKKLKEQGLDAILVVRKGDKRSKPTSTKQKCAWFKETMKAGQGWLKEAPWYRKLAESCKEAIWV